MIDIRQQVKTLLQENERFVVVLPDEAPPGTAEKIRQGDFSSVPVDEREVYQALHELVAEGLVAYQVPAGSDSENWVLYVKGDQ